ncbi:MAG: hypothetical protein K8L99_05590 [Anaerolineae bacterium]|nr:hypothetical protein [Anaerolineae bacterium]
MNPIDHAIMRTVLYADVFDFPLTPPEIHHYLIHDTPTSLEQVQAALADSPELRRKLIECEGYIACTGREAIVQQRIERQQAAAHLWPLAVYYGRLLAHMPFVRMVAITGALAVNNVSGQDDDLDYLLVTAPDRVWIARAFAIILVRLAQRRGVTLCPNYVLAESALLQKRKDLFIAHEIVQMVPVFGSNLYQQFREANDWTQEHLPNATARFHHEPEYQPARPWHFFKRMAEWLLGGRLGHRLENWEYRRKLRRFAPQMRTPGSAAELDQNHVKGHFNDYGHPVLSGYYDRLHQHGLVNHPVVGD